MGVESALPGQGTTGATTAKIVIAKGLWDNRPTEGVEISAARDVMPSGIGLPYPQTFIRNGTDPNESRYPTQVKAFIWNNWLQIMQNLFGPGGDEPRASRQDGGGVVGGVDLFSDCDIVGLSTRVASGAAASRRSVGAYAKLGFGRWGILAEHDLTARNRITDAGAKADTYHLAGHTQLFVAAKEWLVMSLAAEHLVVDGTTATAHTYRLTPGVKARLSPEVTLLFNMRDVFVDANGGALAHLPRANGREDRSLVVLFVKIQTRNPGRIALMNIKNLRIVVAVIATTVASAEPQAPAATEPNFGRPGRRGPPADRRRRLRSENLGHHGFGLGFQRPADRRRRGVGNRPADPQDRHWHARPPHEGELSRSREGAVVRATRPSRTSRSTSLTARRPSMPRSCCTASADRSRARRHWNAAMASTAFRPSSR